jgi:hypothetical protein
MNGDFSSAPIAGGDAAGDYNADIRLQCLLAGGRVKDAVADGSLEKLLAEPSVALEASIAWNLAGNSAEAAKWREKAAVALAQGDLEMKRAAEMLRAANPPTASQLDDAVLQPQEKCLLAAAPLARTLNIGRKPPYQLVRQVVEGGPAGRPKADAAAP